MRTLIYAFVALSATYVVFCQSDEKYYEELHISPQRNGFIATTFKFLFRRPGELGNHYELFPKVIGEILQKYSVDEFHFSLADSFWRTYEWGYQPAPATPTGAQLWAWFNENSTETVDVRWPQFLYSLGSLFCVSLTQTAPQQQTAQPRLGYRPQGVLAKKDSGKIDDNNFLRYIVLAEERVCTENLVPWKKLLPFKGQSGIGSLLIGSKLHSSHFRSMAIDVRRVCENGHCVNGKGLSWELVATMTLVFDVARDNELGPWAFSSLFGTHITFSCPVATSSSVYVDIQGEKPVLKPANWTDLSVGDHRFAVFDVPSVIDTIGFFKLFAIYSAGTTITVNEQSPPVYIHSFIAGTGLREGLLVSQLINNLDVRVTVLYSQIIPWFLRTYYHTLEIVCDGKRKEPNLISYQPGRDRIRPYLLEFAIDLPPTPNRPCEVSIQFERALLRYTEYPPDAHHGFPIAAPMISFYHQLTNDRVPIYTSSQGLLSLNEHDNRTGSPARTIIVAYGKSLLVNLPTPDFSMPYNVICLVCTVVALAFGPVHSLTTKSFIVADPEKVKKRKALTKIKEKLRRVLEGVKKVLLRRREQDTGQNESDEKEALEKKND